MTPPPCQPTLLEPVPPHARLLVFGLAAGADPRPALRRLASTAADARAVIGLGAPLVAALGATVPGLRPFPGLPGPGVTFPSTQGAVWAYLAGGDRGEILDRAFTLAETLGPGFRVEDDVDAFKYGPGHDLTGFEDGTENPKGGAAVEAAIVAGRGPGLDGSSFVAIQKYRHDRASFRALTADGQDAVIGRRRLSNEEIADAHASAHVKRSAQESFDPPAFMLRRSMPWGGVAEHGLYFVAFGESLDRFERVLARMAGRDDGVVDALLSHTLALTGGYYWCPPVRGGALDLSRLGL
jgi:putative iron-dependent peroxidase